MEFRTDRIKKVIKVINIRAKGLVSIILDRLVRLSITSQILYMYMYIIGICNMTADSDCLLILRAAN